MKTLVVALVGTSALAAATVGSAQQANPQAIEIQTSLDFHGKELA